MTPLQFTRSVRSLNRLRQIAQVLTQHGFGYIVSQMNLARFVPVWMLRGRKAAKTLDEGATTIGRRLVHVFADLGPTFIKLAQLMSARPDIVPAEVADQLRTLQDDVPPFDTALAMQIIARDLERPIEQCFARIDAVPRASGSIGQVYAADSHDGVKLMVKVRRPGIEEILRLDMQLLSWLAQSLENLIPESRPYRPRMLVDELDQMLQREVDYVNEASATARFGKAFEGDVGIRIPKVYWEMSSSRVLTLEALPGTSIGSLFSGGPDGAGRIDRRLAARRIAECYLKQIFEFGSFHADPHPGNFLIEPGSVVGLVDFGQVGTVSDELLSELIILVYAGLNQEIAVVVDTLADMGAVGPEANRRGLQRALQQLLDKYHGLAIRRFNLGTLLSEFSCVIRRHDVVMPQDLAMLMKTLATASGVIARLDPELDLVELITPRIKKAVRDRLSASQLTRQAGLFAWDLLSVIRQAPGRLREAMRRMTSGLQVHIRHENIDRLIQELDRSSNRLAFSIVIAGIIVGSSVVISAETELRLFNIKVQHFGIVGYLIAAVLGLGLTWAIVRSGRLH